MTSIQSFHGPHEVRQVEVVDPVGAFPHHAPRVRTNRTHMEAET